jgi:hypothetical protein
VEFDVTTQVKEALLGDMKISLAILAAVPASNTLTRYVSGQYPLKAWRPQLLVFTETPVILPIPNQTITKNGSAEDIPVVVWDTEDPPEALALRGRSSNPLLLPESNLVFGGSSSSSNRTLSVTPERGQTGVAKVTVTVTDQLGASASQWFLLTVQPVLDPDSDDDGMPDDYELTFGLDPADPQDAHGDLDGDGESNLREYLAGTDPTRAGSALRFIDLWFDQDAVALVFPTVLGKAYRVERSETMPASSWTTVASNLPGTGFLQHVLDPLDHDSTRFYRLSVAPEPSESAE